MHVSKSKEPQITTRDMFTGTVSSHNHVTEEHAKALRVNLVHFEPGGRTKWHTHTFEQGLIVVEGKGIVATEDAEHVIEPGDGMSHFSINPSAGESTVIEPVTEVKTKV
jgi:quercetin dioxygenase-like cupin family protein